MDKLDIYIASSVVLAAGVYLHSPAVCLGGIVLWGLAVAESVLRKENRDADIATLIKQMEKLEKEHKTLAQDITNVHERAKVILGDQF